MEAYQAVLVAVVALLVGALLPVLFQLVLTLRAVRSVAEQAGPAITSLTATAERIERLTARIEEGGRVDNALAAVDSLTVTVGKLQETARMASSVGAAVIPAVAAAIRAWGARGEDEAKGPAVQAAPEPPAANVRVAP